MLHSETTDEMIRELNNWIVQSKETAEYTRKYVQTVSGANEFYLQFGNYIAARTDHMADELTETLGRVTSLTQHPDEISARFVILKALEDTAFQSRITAFQVRLMITRANSQHRTAFEPICAKYDTLAQNAQIKADRIAGFFSELCSQIFSDMREQAKEKLQKAVELGKIAADRLLNDPDLPYAYIADAITAIINELSQMPLEEVTVSLLEDHLQRLDVVACAADMDVLRMPSHKELFDGILDFKERIREAAIFFQSLWDDVVRTSGKPEKSSIGNSEKSSAGGLVFQGNILLFFLKGEIQKLEPHLSHDQKAAFDAVCENMKAAVRQAKCEENDTNVKDTAQSFQDIYEKLTAEAGRLGVYGGAIQFIADEIRRAVDGKSFLDESTN